MGSEWVRQGYVRVGEGRGVQDWWTAAEDAGERGRVCVREGSRGQQQQRQQHSCSSGLFCTMCWCVLIADKSSLHLCCAGFTLEGHLPQPPRCCQRGFLLLCQRQHLQPQVGKPGGQPAPHFDCVGGLIGAGC